MSSLGQRSVDRISIVAGKIREAEDDMADARHNGDDQAFAYAEGRSLRYRRELAKLDPRGYGHPHLSLLSEVERDAVLR